MPDTKAKTRRVAGWDEVESAIIRRSGLLTYG